MSSLLEKLGDNRARQWIEMHLDYPHDWCCLIWPFSRIVGGYGSVGGEDGSIRVHRIMCEHRNGAPPTPEHQAAHSCGRGDDGCVNQWHLTWKTAAENQIERFQHLGRPAPRTKLTPEQVDEIRALKGRERPGDTAARFHMSDRNIRDIQEGKLWKADRIDQRTFSEQEVLLIRATPWQEKTAMQWATEFHVSRSTIDRIRTGKIYRYYLPEFTKQLEPTP